MLVWLPVVFRLRRSRQQYSVTLTMIKKHMPHGERVSPWWKQATIGPVDRQVDAHRSITHRLSAAMPWLAFLAIMLLSWRRTNLLHMVPSAYGDVLEGTWATMWLGDSLRHGTNPSLYPLAFHPVGWPVITYAWGPTNFLLLIPLYWLGGAAFAYNVATIAGFLVTFSGTYLLAQRFLPRFPATVSALLFTVWGFRWYTVGGQLNIGLGSALLPWFIWCLEVGSQSKRKPWLWYGLAGVTWALATNSSLYFIWIDAVAFGAWFLARCWLGKGALRAGLYRSLLAPVVAGLFSLPLVYLFWQASSTVGAPFFSVYDVNLLGASLNVLPVPYILHPWLGTLTQAVYKGPFPAEVSSLGLGTLSCLTALYAVRGAWRSQTWRPLFGARSSWSGAISWPDDALERSDGAVDVDAPVQRLCVATSPSLTPRFLRRRSAAGSVHRRRLLARPGANCLAAGIRTGACLRTLCVPVWAGRFYAGGPGHLTNTSEVAQIVAGSAGHIRGHPAANAALALSASA